MFWCTINPIKGSPAFTTTKASDVLSTAKDALNALQTLSPKSNLANVQNLLNSVTELKNSKTTTAEGMLKIGSSEAKISEQKAIQIATEHAQAYSWVQNNETVSNVTVLSDPIIANLTLQNRENATLYPYWDIWLPLDKMYPGGETGFHVGVWADTGEIGFISPIGYGGAPEDVPSESQETTSNNNLTIAIMLIAATAVIVSYLFYKRKR